MKLTSALALLLRVTLSMTSCDAEQLYYTEKTSLISMVMCSVLMIMIVASFVPVPIRGIRAVILDGDIMDDFDVHLDIDIYYLWTWTVIIPSLKYICFRFFVFNVNDIDILLIHDLFSFKSNLFRKWIFCFWASFFPIVEGIIRIERVRRQNEAD